MDSRTKHQKRLDDLHVIKMNSLDDVWQAVRNKKDYSESLFNMYHIQLMELEDVAEDMNHVKIIGSSRNPPCSECEKLIEKVFKFTEEIREQHLPNKKCSNEIGKVEPHEFCMFYYEAVFDDEL